jgi:hypothetical protein
MVIAGWCLQHLNDTRYCQIHPFPSSSVVSAHHNIIDYQLTLMIGNILPGSTLAVRNTTTTLPISLHDYIYTTIHTLSALLKFALRSKLSCIVARTVVKPRAACRCRGRADRAMVIGG